MSSEAVELKAQSLGFVVKLGLVGFRVRELSAYPKDEPGHIFIVAYLFQLLG